MTKRSVTVVLQSAIVLAGAGALAFLLWEPRVEGRNAHADLVAIYFKDPFLAYAYLSSIPLFVALRQAFKALGRVRDGEAYSPANEKALRSIKRCALTVVGCVGLSVFFLPFGDRDDRPAGVFMRLLVAVPAAVVAAAAAKGERVLHNRIT